MSNTFDVIIRIDKLNTVLSKEDLRIELSKYVNSINHDHSQIQIFGDDNE